MANRTEERRKRKEALKGDAKPRPAAAAFAPGLPIERSPYPTIAESVLTAGIANVIRLSEALTDVDHSGTLGLLREALVESVICPLLQYPLKAATGVVIDCVGTQSGQCDIIIWDDSIFRPFYFARGAGLFAIESVVGTIEIKSRLTSESEVHTTGERQGQKNGRTNHFKQALRNAHRLSQMRCLNGEQPYDRYDPGWSHPGNTIFAFKSAVADPKAMLERMGEELRAAGEVEREASHYVQGIDIPGQRCWQFASMDEGTTSQWLYCDPEPEPGAGPGRDPRLGPYPDLREVRVNLSGFLNSLQRVARSRGHPRIGNYTAFRHGAS